MASEPERLRHSSDWTEPVHEQRLYQRFSVAEEISRTNYHYEQPAEFFTLITGGEWNVYSGNLWDGVTSDTESQVAKLDLLAILMDLRECQTVLDIGCGWGGPLVYLSKKYKVKGLGLTLSPSQREFSAERAAKYEVDVHFVQSHWRDFTRSAEFDVIMTDEVIVHFADFTEFCLKAYSLLKPGGLLVNKELHFTHSKYKQISRSGAFINDIYGSTGNYRLLADELTILDQCGFAQITLHQIPIGNYRVTAEHWLANMSRHKQRLIALVGLDHYRRFRTYLKIVRKMMTGSTMTLDIVVSQKL